MSSETLAFSQTTMNRRSVASLGNASAGSTPWYVKAGNFLRSGATSVGKKVGEFGTNVWNGASNFFSNAGRWGSERLNDLREWGKSAGEYTWKSITKFVLGDYSDDNITALSFAGNIVTGSSMLTCRLMSEISFMMFSTGERATTWRLLCVGCGCSTSCYRCS